MWEVNKISIIVLCRVSAVQASQPHSAKLCAAEQGALAAAILYTSPIIDDFFRMKLIPFNILLEN